MQVQVTDQYFGELSNAQTLINGNQYNVAAPVTSALGVLNHSLQNLFTIHGSRQRLGQMSFHADPVTDSNDIYDAYLGFAHNPALFVVSDHAPAKCDYHILRKVDHCYYWVPKAAAPDFQELVLKTTFKRGPETIPPGFYQVKVVGVTKSEATSAIFQFDKQVPAGDGHLVVQLPNGTRHELSVHRATQPDPDGKTRAPGELTLYLKALWAPEDRISALDLIGVTVHAYSDDYPPELTAAPSTDIQQIRQGVDRVRSALSPFLSPPGT